MDKVDNNQNLSQDQLVLKEAAIESNLALSFEERIEAHENALRLISDLIEAGTKIHEESKSSS